MSSTSPVNVAGLGREADGQIIERCRAGDQAAWAVLVDRYGRLVYSIPRRYGFDQSSAEDAFQEVFSALFRQLGQLRNPTALPKWLMTTTHRVCRRMKQDRGLVLAPEHPALQAAEPPEDLLMQWESRDHVRRALRRLGGPCEELLSLLYFERSKMRYEEIAGLLNMAVGSVGPTRARCLRKLLDLMRDHEDE